MKPGFEGGYLVVLKPKFKATIRISPVLTFIIHEELSSPKKYYIN